MNEMRERNKVDVGIAPYTMAVDVISEYYPMVHYRKALVEALIAVLAEGESIELKVWEATNAAGGGPPQQLGVTQTFTQGVNATRVEATLVAVAVGDTITINGVVFTAAAVANLPNQIFSQAGDDTADAASLVLAINHAAAQALFVAAGGAITASSALGVVTLVSTIPGQVTISTSETGVATIALVDLQQVGIFEVDVPDMDSNNGFTHIAAGLYNGQVTTYGAVVIVRSMERYAPVPQAVAFSARS